MSKVRTPEPMGFAEFWSAWMPFRRKNDGRGEARECYRKHILAGAMPADIIDGARGYLRSLTERDKPYVPLAATWLNREAYADWCDGERAYQQRLAEMQERKPVSHETEPAIPSMSREEREAAQRRIFEKHGLQPPGGELH